MDEVLHANVFFFITGIAVIVLSAILCIVLFQVIRVLKSVRRILQSVERGTEAVASDMQTIREHFMKGGLIGGIMSVFTGMKEKKQTTTKKRPTGKKNSKKSELKITDVTR